MLRQFFRREEKTPVEEQISAVLTEMNNVGVDSEKYPKLLAHLKGLHEIQTKERRHSVSPDTIAIIVGGLLQILLIVAYEQKHVLNSKGLNQITRHK